MHCPLSHVCISLHLSTLELHLHPDPSQSSPVTWPTQELSLPHLQAPALLLAVLSQVSGDVHASRDEVHLHLLLVASQYAPVVIKGQLSRVAVHLQTLFAESQKAPVINDFLCYRINCAQNWMRNVLVSWLLVT